jgi:hypothetical protein
MNNRIVGIVRGNLVAWIALFVALGGTSLAASHYVVTSTKQIKPKVLKSLASTNTALFKNLAKTTTVANANVAVTAGTATTARTAATAGTATTAGSATTAASATHATDATNANHANSADSAPYIDSLPAGKTLRGTWAARGGGNQFAFISLGHRTNAPTTFHFVAPAATPPAQCPGSVSDPQAQAGHMCAYAFNMFGGTEAFNEEFDGETGTIGTSGRDGAVLFFTNSGGDGAAYGTWAVTGN